MTAAVAALGVTSLMAGLMVMGTAGSAGAAPPDKEPKDGDTRYPDVGICHATGSSGWSYVSPDAVGTVEAHMRHQSGRDVIPAFVYEVYQNGEWTQVEFAGQNLGDVDFVGEGGCKAPVELTAVTPQAPTVVQPTTCEVEGSYTIPGTEGVQYLLDGEPVAAGTYSGPVSGTVTAVALEGYELTEPLSFALDVAAAEKCPVEPTAVTPQAPTVVQPTTCEVEGSYTIPGTEGVQYLLDGEPVAAGTYSGPVSGTVTAAALKGYELTEPLSFALDVAAAEKCQTTPTTPVTDEETEKPKPTKPKPKPTIKPAEADKPDTEPDEIAGTQAVPTAVAAGLGGPAVTAGSTGSMIGQGLVAAGLLMLLLAGSLQVGRRERGAHEV